MHPDKKLILIGLIVSVLLAAGFYVFRDVDLDKENAILDELEAMSEAIPDMELYYSPLTNQERIHLVEDHLEKVTAAQNKIAGTVLGKLFVDFSEAIEAYQNELAELRQNHGPESENDVSFNTKEGHSIISEREFTKESLLKLASVVDSVFPGNEGIAVFLLDCEYGYVTLAIIPLEKPENFEKIDPQEFAILLSDEVFNGDPVLVDIDIDTPSKML